MSNVCLCELRRRSFTIYKQVCIVLAGTNFATTGTLVPQRSAEFSRLHKAGGVYILLSQCVGRVAFNGCCCGDNCSHNAYNDHKDITYNRYQQKAWQGLIMQILCAFVFAEIEIIFKRAGKTAHIYLVHDKWQGNGKCYA